MNSTSPNHRLMTPATRLTPKITPVTNTRIRTSPLMSFWWTTSAPKSAEIPSTARTLNMLLPTTLPMARLVSPSMAACTPTAISGALVPKATTVRPTTSGDTPRFTARCRAPRTRTSAPATRATSPTTTSTTDMTVIGDQRASGTHG